MSSAAFSKRKLGRIGFICSIYNQYSYEKVDEIHRVDKEFNIFAYAINEIYGIKTPIDKSFVDELVENLKKNYNKIIDILDKKMHKAPDNDLVTVILICGLSEILSGQDPKLIASIYTDICSIFMDSYQGLVNKILQEPVK